MPLVKASAPISSVHPWLSGLRKPVLSQMPPLTLIFFSAVKSVGGQKVSHWFWSVRSIVRPLVMVRLDCCCKESLP
ncbi:hypothetical protein, partial [Parabacteroides sp.]